MCWIGALATHSIIICLLGTSLIFGSSLGYPPAKLNTFNLIYFVCLVVTWIGVFFQWLDDHREREIIILSPPRRPSSESHDVELTITGNKFSIVCPICRQQNLVLENQSKLYGVDNKCTVCLEQTCDVYLPTCGHVCICYKCALHGKTDQMSIPPV
jgi:hypothetical protein